MAGNECLPGAFEAWPRPRLDATTAETERLLPDERAGETERLLSEDTTTTRAFFARRLGRGSKGLAKEPLLTLSSLSEETSYRARSRPTAC